MSLAKGRRDTNSDAQEPSHLHRSAKQPAKQLAAGILKHQNASPAISHKLKRPHRPCAVKVILEVVFAGKAIKGGWCRLLRRWGCYQYFLALAPRAVTPPSGEDEAAVLRQNLRAIYSVRAEPGKWLHSQALPLSRPQRPAMHELAADRRMSTLLADVSLPRSSMICRLALSYKLLEAV